MECQDKVYYRTARSAKRSAERYSLLFNHPEPKKVYKCPTCGKYHLTSNGTSTLKKLADVHIHLIDEINFWTTRLNNKFKENKKVRKMRI